MYIKILFFNKKCKSTFRFNLHFNCAPKNAPGILFRKSARAVFYIFQIIYLPAGRACAFLLCGACARALLLCGGAFAPFYFAGARLRPFTLRGRTIAPFYFAGRVCAFFTAPPNFFCAKPPEKFFGANPPDFLRTAEQP